MSSSSGNKFRNEHTKVEEEETTLTNSIDWQRDRYGFHFQSSIRVIYGDQM